MWLVFIRLSSVGDNVMLNGEDSYSFLVLYLVFLRRGWSDIFR